MPKPVPGARPFNAPLYAFKALGIATVIVSVVAVCAVKATTWYMDVHNVSTFEENPPPVLMGQGR
jgi:hypothetical protein